MIPSLLLTLLSSTPFIDGYLSACALPADGFVVPVSARSPAIGTVRLAKDGRVEVEHCFYENSEARRARTVLEGLTAIEVKEGDVVNAGQRLGRGAKVKVTITKGQPPAIVLEQGIEASGSLALGGPVDIPSLGGKLNGGSIDGSATVTAETRIPLPSGVNLGDVVRDPVGAVKNVGQQVLNNTTTKLSLGVDVSGGAAIEGLGLGASGGLEVELSGEAKTKDLAGALGQAMRGDLKGALTTLGTKTNLEVDVNSYTQSDLINIDEEISVPGFTIGIKAQDSIRDETDVWSFEGTPAELARQGFNLFDKLNMNVS